MLKNVIENQNQNVPVGIWTPWASIICYECHGKKFVGAKYNHELGKFEDKILDDKEFEKAKSEIPLKEDNAITKCSKCGSLVQLNKSTAQENNLFLKLKEAGINAEMSQTGGMNSAVELRKEDGGFVWITYDVFGADDEYEWYLGVYDEEGCYDDEFYSTTSENDMVKHIIEMKESSIIK